MARARAAIDRTEAARRRHEAARRRHQATRRRVLAGVGRAHAELGSEMAAMVHDRRRERQETFARSRDAVARAKNLRSSARAMDRMGS